jgi:excisionase family DNA binding protein
MTRVLIPLPGIGTLDLSQEAYEAALRPVEAPKVTDRETLPALVNAEAVAAALSLPKSCIYEYAKAGRIPSVRAGRHVRFDLVAVRVALGAATVGHS